MKLEEMIEVMQAALEGKPIEFRAIGREYWHCAQPKSEEFWTWNWEEREYRIAQVPHVKYFIEFPDGGLSSSNFDTAEEAREWWSKGLEGRVVKMVEVTDYATD